MQYCCAEVASRRRRSYCHSRNRNGQSNTWSTKLPGSYRQDRGQYHLIRSYSPSEHRCFAFPSPNYASPSSGYRFPLALAGDQSRIAEYRVTCGRRHFDRAKLVVELTAQSSCREGWVLASVVLCSPVARGMDLYRLVLEAGGSTCLGGYMEPRSIRWACRAAAGPGDPGISSRSLLL